MFVAPGPALSYFVHLSDEAASQDGQEEAGQQLQEEAVEPHVEREQGLIDHLEIVAQLGLNLASARFQL